MQLNIKVIIFSTIFLFIVFTYGSPIIIGILPTDFIITDIYPISIFLIFGLIAGLISKKPITSMTITAILLIIIKLTGSSETWIRAINAFIHPMNTLQFNASIHFLFLLLNSLLLVLGVVIGLIVKKLLHK
jgi:hypothetical protein